MLTALSTLSAQLKADPAPASAPRPGATFEGDNSFASVIRRQAEQRLDTLRLADQQALAARVSAAAATSMPRPIVEKLASQPPMPAQAPAKPNPPLAPPSAATASASASASASAPAPAPASTSTSAPAPTSAPTSAPATTTAPTPTLAPTPTPTPTPATVTADSSGTTPPSPAPTRPAQAAAAAARAKPPSGASRTDSPRSPATRSGPADSPAANRSPRERKPGTASGAEASAEVATAGVAGPPLPMADTGPTRVVGDGGGAPAPDPAAALQPAPRLPQDLIALPAAPAPAETGAAMGPGAETAEGTGQIGPRLTGAHLPAATRAVAHAEAPAEALRTASSLPPVQAMSDDPAPALADPRSPATTLARSGRVPVIGADPLRQGADLAIAANGALAQQLGRVSEPVTERPLEHRPRSPGGPAAPPAAQPEGLTAAAQSGAWRPGSAPAAGDNPAAPVENQPANRRAGPGIDRSGPEPRHAAGPAAVGGPAAAAVVTAPAQPDAAAPGRFDTALQAVLSQGPAQPGPVAGADRSAKPLLAMQIDAPVDSPRFAPALGSQLSLLARDGVRSALLQLHPAEMGPISVEIALDGNAARIDFQALRADTRSLIEASLPALAGALQDAGLTLAGGGVFEQAPGRQPQAQAQHEPGPAARPPGPADSGPAGQQDTAHPARRSAPRGLVDLVA